MNKEKIQKNEKLRKYFTDMVSEEKSDLPVFRKHNNSRLKNILLEGKEDYFDMDTEDEEIWVKSIKS